MILKGIEVTHKAFGIGTVSEHVDNHITIIFPRGEKKFIYPDAFKVFIKATDDAVNDKIQKEITIIEAAKKESELKSKLTIVRETKNTYDVPKKSYNNL